MNESLRQKQRTKYLRELHQYQKAQMVGTQERAYAFVVAHSEALRSFEPQPIRTPEERAADAMKAYDEAIRRRDFLRRQTAKGETV